MRYDSQNFTKVFSLILKLQYRCHVHEMSLLQNLLLLLTVEIT